MITLCHQLFHSFLPPTEPSQKSFLPWGMTCPSGKGSSLKDCCLKQASFKMCSMVQLLTLWIPNKRGCETFWNNVRFLSTQPPTPKHNGSEVFLVAPTLAASHSFRMASVLHIQQCALCTAHAIITCNAKEYHLKHLGSDLRLLSVTNCCVYYTYKDFCSHRNVVV